MYKHSVAMMMILIFSSSVSQAYPVYQKEGSRKYHNPPPMRNYRESYMPKKFVPQPQNYQANYIPKKSVPKQTYQANYIPKQFATPPRNYLPYYYPDGSDCGYSEPTCVGFGPYIGISTGPIINFAHDPAAYHGWSGTLNGGYEIISKYVYFAGEIWGSDSGKIKNYTSDDDGSVRSTWSVGFSLLPAFLITDNFWLYFRGGIGRAHFRNNFDTDCHCNDGQDRNGWHVGLGAMSNLIGPWDIRVEYMYGQYKSLANLGNPRMSQFNIGFTFRCI